jgi:hypothetical protein
MTLFQEQNREQKNRATKFCTITEPQGVTVRIKPMAKGTENS